MNDKTDDPNYECGDCQHLWALSETVEAKHLSQRLDPNGPYTDRECPECGALCYEVEEDGHSASLDWQGFNIIITRSTEDKRVVVFIDSSGLADDSTDQDEQGCPKLRVNVNDSEVYDSDRDEARP